MDFSRNRSLDKATNPAEIAKLIIDFDDKDAASITEQNGNTIDVSFRAF